SLLSDAETSGTALDQDALTREKKRLIEESSGGLLTFMTSDVGLDQVAGYDAAKALLRETAQALARGRLDVVPMGYLICGPVGTGKSFIVRCFAREIGIPVETAQLPLQVAGTDGGERRADPGPARRDRPGSRRGGRGRRRARDAGVRPRGLG